MDDGSTLTPGADRDVDIRDDTPHLTFRDTDDNAAFQFHLESGSGGAPWQGLTLWQGTDAGNAFTVGTARPTVRVDTSGNLYFPFLQSVGAQRCINLDATGQLSLASAACGTGGGGNSFETISVPAGTAPVADSATDTLTITETTFLTITGTAGTDTIDITQVTTDIGTDGLIAANAVALATDTTGAYVEQVADGTGIDGTANAEQATYTPTLDLTEITCGTNLTCPAATTINVDDAISLATSVTSPMFSSNAADPADAGIVRLGNAEVIGWEVAPAGTDVTLAVDSAEAITWSGHASMTLGTSAALTVGAIELGAAADTTLSRPAAGRLQIEGVDALTVAGRSLTASTSTVDADAELYTDTKCYRVVDPVAADDDKSIWRNSTANQFTITELWAESDQTVNLMLQVDDGTPADVDTVDLAPAAGEAEDTSLNGDATVGVSEELDLDLVSVSNTPTFVTICFTGTWDD